MHLLIGGECVYEHTYVTHAGSTHVNIDIRMCPMPLILCTCLYMYVMCLRVLTYGRCLCGYHCVSMSMRVSLTMCVTCPISC